jgi:predicted nucleotidyltransferase
MRLTAPQMEAIKVTIFKRDPKAGIFLFGSRIDDSLKGGDLDLLILSDQLEFKDRIDLLVELKIKLGDQKIDLLIRKNAFAQSDPFVIEILKNAIPL